MADNKRTCSIPTCEKPHLARGWCHAHYTRWRRHGDPLAGGPDVPHASTEERFRAKINKTATCWIWIGGLSDTGYGGAWDGEKVKGAHRMSWEMHRGPIPEGMHLDHRCHNRACVNPGHLRIATTKQNLENHQGPTVSSTTRARGVYLDKRRGSYYAQVTHNGKTQTMSGFATVEEAEAAVIAKRIELHTYNDRDRIAA